MFKNKNELKRLVKQLYIIKKNGKVLKAFDFNFLKIIMSTNQHFNSKFNPNRALLVFFL